MKSPGRLMRSLAFTCAAIAVVLAAGVAQAADVYVDAATGVDPIGCAVHPNDGEGASDPHIASSNGCTLS